MKKRNWKRIICFSLLSVLILSVFLTVPRMARAGFGDFDSRSDFGGSDFGSSSFGSSDSSSDSDSDGFDLYALLQVADFVGRLFGIKSPYVSLAILLIIIAFLKFVLPDLKGSSHRSAHKGITHDALYRPESLQQLSADDPAFDSAALIQRVRDLFEKMQLAWEAGNIDSLRKDFMPDTWTRFNTQLQNKIAVGETAHVRDIVFDQVSLLSYSTDAEHQILNVKIDVTHNIWTTNQQGKCIQGTEKTRKKYEYVWTMLRPLGSVTGGAVSGDTAHCPNCGADIDLEAFAECPFCHTPVMKVSPDWVISEIDALSQQTLHK